MEWHTVRKINMRRRIGLGIVALLFLSLVLPNFVFAEPKKPDLEGIPNFIFAPPKTYHVEGLSRGAAILRDKWGIPHIYGQTEEDLFFAQGFNAASG